MQVQTPPVFQSVTATDGSLVFSGAGGPTNVPYYVLASTNIALPVAGWPRIATNQFDAFGGFNWTNISDSNLPQSFYRLQLP